MLLTSIYPIDSFIYIVQIGIQNGYIATWDGHAQRHGSADLFAVFWSPNFARQKKNSPTWIIFGQIDEMIFHYLT